MRVIFRMAGPCFPSERSACDCHLYDGLRFDTTDDDALVPPLHDECTCYLEVDDDQTASRTARAPGNT